MGSPWNSRVYVFVSPCEISIQSVLAVTLTVPVPSVLPAVAANMATNSAPAGMMRHLMPASQFQRISSNVCGSLFAGTLGSLILASQQNRITR